MLKRMYISVIMILLLSSACSVNDNVDSVNNTETKLASVLEVSVLEASVLEASVLEENTESEISNLVKNDEFMTDETIDTSMGGIEDIQPSPKNVYNYVNEISANYDISNYDINELREEASKVEENENITIPDEILLQQKMIGDILQEASEYFNISFQETIDLFIEGSYENENAQ